MSIFSDYEIHEAEAMRWYGDYEDALYSDDYDEFSQAERYLTNFRDEAKAAIALDGPRWLSEHGAFGLSLSTLEAFEEALRA
jgi:hypothetical protein